MKRKKEQNLYSINLNLTNIDFLVKQDHYLITQHFDQVMVFHH